MTLRASVRRLSLGLVAFALVACGSTLPSATAAPPATAAPSTSPSAVVASASTQIGSPRPSAVASVDPCVGACTAGQHRSVRFQPRLAFTVPQGWFAAGDELGEYVLKFGSATTDDGLFIFRDPVAHSQRADCPDATGDPTVGTSAKQLSDWIAALPGLVVTRPSGVTVGGLHGFELTVRVASTWRHACPYSNGQPTVPLIVSGLPGSDLDWGVGGSGRMRIDLLDVPAGTPVWIDVETISGGAFDQLNSRAAPIIDSMMFAAP
jgi:hypothetical protein